MNNMLLKIVTKSEEVCGCYRVLGSLQWSSHPNMNVCIFDIPEVSLHVFRNLYVQKKQENICKKQNCFYSIKS